MERWGHIFVKRVRADQLLVRLGLAATRTKAQALIMAGDVIAGAHRVDKPGALLAEDMQVRIKGANQRFVSRGGLKLEHALETFKLDVQGLVCADIGASTGGFTHCLLLRGAAKVYAIDVGHGQLHETLRGDPRVVAIEGCNARNLSEREIPVPIDFAVVDVSFISLRLVLPPLLARLRDPGTLVVLVKPQFEVERGEVGKNGVVRDPIARERAIAGIRSFIETRLRMEVLGLVDAPIRGKAGNLEALLAARRVPAGTGR